MINNDYAKQDFAKGMNLEDLFKDIPSVGNDEEFMAELREALAELADEMNPAELDGYYPYRFFVSDRYYYPKAGTMKNLPMGMILFEDAMMGPDSDGRPVYTTLPYDSILAITWLPQEEVDDQAEALPFPAAA